MHAYFMLIKRSEERIKRTDKKRLRHRDAFHWISIRHRSDPRILASAKCRVCYRKVKADQPCTPRQSRAIYDLSFAKSFRDTLS